METVFDITDGELERVSKLESRHIMPQHDCALFIARGPKMAKELLILRKMVSAMAENEAQVSNFGRHYDEDKNTKERVLEKYRRQFGWYK